MHFAEEGTWNQLVISSKIRYRERSTKIKYSKNIFQRYLQQFWDEALFILIYITTVICNGLTIVKVDR